MLRVHLFLLALALAACSTPQSGGRPEAVLVERDRITVSMSTGWPCTGFRTPATETADGWAGTLEGCPDPYPYRVALKDKSNPVRMVLEEALTALGGEHLLRPVAIVEIDAKGRTYTFRSPN